MSPPNPTPAEQPSPIISRPGPTAVTYDLTNPDRVRITLPPGSRWSSGLHWHESHAEYLRLISGSIRVRLGDEVRVLSASAASEKTEIRVARGVWHEWCRADAGVFGYGGEEEGKALEGEGEGIEGDGEEEVVVEERTDPEDGQKAVFFYNLNGVILQAQQGRAQVPGWMTGWWVSLNLWVIFRELDNYPVFVGFADGIKGCIGGSGRKGRGGWLRERTLLGELCRLLDWRVTHLLLWAASWVGFVVGVRGVRRQRMPGGEWERWIAGRDQRAKKKA